VPNKYVALDLETTGLDPDSDAVTEIGVVKFSGSQVLEEFQTLVNPKRQIPLEIQQLTGITPAMVAKAPSLNQVRDKLRNMVGDLPIVGHNIGFDLSFLRPMGLFTKNPSIDTFELASILMPHADRYNLATLAETLGVTRPATHRAMDDAQVTHALFVALLEEALTVDPEVIQTIKELADRSSWSLQPVFADLERMRARRTFTSSLGQQLAAKGALSLGDGGRGLFADDDDMEDVPPLRPAPKARPLDVDTLAALLAADGLFAQQLPAFEHRAQQVDMLRLVADAFNQQDHLMVEAGTGTGKSIAYLLPAIYWATTNGLRVVVSTHTINLQDQLLKKDVPDLQQLLRVNFRAVSLKGRHNYVCPYRVRQFVDALRGRLRRGSHEYDLELRVVAKALVWLSTTVSGDKQELFLPTPAENAIWSHLCSDAEFCGPDRCRHENCFFHRARQAAERAHIVVVNHALLLADAAAGNRVLPEYHHLIIDEAHHLEDSVTNQLSFTADQQSLERLLGLVSEPIGRTRHLGFFSQVGANCAASVPRDHMAKVAALVEEGHAATATARDSVTQFFSAISGFIAETSGNRNSQYDLRLRITPSTRRQPAWDQVEIAWDNLSVSLTGLEQAFQKVRDLLEFLDNAYSIEEIDSLWGDLSGYRAQIEEIHAQLKAVIEQPPQNAGNSVIWIEVSVRTGNISLHAAPLHVGPLVQQHIFNAKDTAVLTSATLRTEQNSDYLRDRLGAYDIREASVGSPFDYESSTLLYLPTDIAEPNRPQYQRALETALIGLVRAIGGRTLVLFTSYSHLRNTAAVLRGHVGNDDILVLEQGSGGSRTQLLERFRTAERAVLMGTRSFWEGIDVTGEQLSCVVIAKLPFAVPDDPVFAARSEAYEDGFSQYSIPDAILRFRQGFGRLIRTQTDRGVVVCLDGRVLQRRYGQAFLDSLPKCTVWRGPLADLPGMAAEWIDGDAADAQRRWRAARRP
jgi:ATP-dependent DNA helicase DinG